MARLNLTIPDALYARLDRLRDRVNVSKVCAIALEKELNMLEGQTSTADPRLGRLIQRLQRLQNNRERWYGRGRQDGENWAIDVAAQKELQWVASQREESDGDYEDMDEDELPNSFSFWGAFKKWLIADLEEAGLRSGNLDRARIGGSFERALEVALKLAEEESADAEVREAVRQQFAEVDKRAYLNGWYAAVAEIWAAVAPVLQAPPE